MSTVREIFMEASGEQGFEHIPLMEKFITENLFPDDSYWQPQWKLHMDYLDWVAAQGLTVSRLEPQIFKVCFERACVIVFDRTYRRRLFNDYDGATGFRLRPIGNGASQ